MILTIISFLFIMSVIVFAHELGHLVIAKRNNIVVEEFGFGYPPRLLKLGEWGGTKYTINAIPFGGFARMRGEEDPTYPGSFAAASKLVRAATLLAGAGMNFILAIILFTVLTLMTGMPDASRPGILIEGVSPGSPAEQAGLQIGDRIISAGETEFSAIAVLQNHTANHLGQSVTYQVVRADTDTTETIMIIPRTDPPEGDGALGIQIRMAVRRARIGEALWTGLKTTGAIIWLTFEIPAMMIREGQPIADAGFLGPVGIAATTGEIVRSAIAIDSILPVLWFMALLSTALGITNLLPIPALDGGRLLFVLFEAIRGKRVAPAQEGIIHLVGFAILILQVGALTVKEIVSLVNGTFPSLGLR